MQHAGVVAPHDEEAPPACTCGLDEVVGG